MKEINLEEILLSTVPKDCYWEEMGNLTNCPKEYALDAMKAACKQLLELAAENARVKEDYIQDYYSLTYDGIEAHAIHKDRVGDPHSISLFTVDKNSIINTINQVK